MKKILLMVPAVALLLLACVPTPTEPIVVGKADGALEQQISATTVPAYREEAPVLLSPVPDATEPPVTEQPPKEPTLKESLGVPERVQDHLEGKAVGANLIIEIDAAVDIPNVTHVPVLRGHILNELPSESERLAKLLLGDGPYLLPGHDDVADAKKQLENAQAWLEALEQKPYGALADYDMLRLYLEGQMKTSAEMLAHPENYYPSRTPSPWNGSFSEIRQCVSLANGQQTFFLTADMFRFRSLTPYLFALGTERDRAPQNAEEQRLAAVAEAFAFSLGFAETKLRSINCFDEHYRIRYDSKTGFDNGFYTFTMLPVYADIPLYPYSTNCGTDTGMQAAGVHYDADKAQEQISGAISDGAICELTWMYPFRVTGTENENVALLPFDEILAIFRRQIFMNQYLDKGFDETVRITEIRFSYMRVKIKDSDEYRLLPVWDFLGYELDPEWDATASPGELAIARSWWNNQSLLTVNAIDGSILNRNLGY